MLKKTRGIVINYTKYSETSIIAKIFTEEMGMKTYIINGVRSNKNGSKIALYQPLTLLDLVVYYKQNNSNIQRISEARCHVPFHNIPFDFQKSTIALFIAEVLSKALREEEENHLLFDFLLNALVWFDDTQKDFRAFHLQFLAKMPRFLGFDPQSADVMIAEVNNQHPVSFPSTKSPQIKQVINQLLSSNFEETIAIESATRSDVIDLLLEYYHLHIGGFGTLKSLTVLREMMD
ncbi:DNA repair protein RecO [uncultured Microscilla sp.]|uniref:DNA repair protein RecO n=1 Tax=uncultured Microscilla sp. TaxID=432653 RepID=UPI00262179E4|nr:DNA repair protein RecO [uncultured Microscilla sp.]